MIWPGYLRRRARRQLGALRTWSKRWTDIWIDAYAKVEPTKADKLQGLVSQLMNDIVIARTHAEGYYNAQDWFGVEAMYNDAKRAIDAFETQRRHGLGHVQKDPNE